MKKPLLFAVFALLAACGSNSTTTPTADSTRMKTDSVVAMRPIQSPYPILYSSSFVADDPKNAESLLAIWKAYDAGDFSTVRNLFADTVEVHLASGLTMRTSRDSTLAAVAAYRNSMKSAVSSISAIMAVKSTDKDQHWALIWGMEKDTHKNGKVDSTELQETWLFDNSGRASLFYQYSAKPAMK